MTFEGITKDQVFFELNQARAFFSDKTLFLDKKKRESVAKTLALIYLACEEEIAYMVRATLDELHFREAHILENPINNNECSF